MIKIIVVEDDINYQKTVEDIIKKLQFKCDEEIKSNYFSKYNKKLENIILDNTSRKIYIMDIELEGDISGIEIAKKIRDKDWESEIIFITSHDKMFETVYRNIYQVFDFIEKYHNMSSRLKKDLDIIVKKNFDNKMFIYSNKFCDLRIYYRNILYIFREKDERKLTIVTDTNKFKVNLSIPEIMELLDDRFKQCHRSCVINVERVQKYDWNEGIFIMDSLDEIGMLSKKYRKAILER